MMRFAQKDCIDLLTLAQMIGESLQDSLPGAFWVKAEISSLQERRGHCYLELCQSIDGKVHASLRAIIWANVYRQIAPYFEFATGAKLQAGQQICVQASVNFSPQYGLSLTINDIDPDFTLGDAERKRAETIERLQKEGLLDAQKGLSLPDLPYRLAVVSSESAAGYRDFVRQLHGNPYGYRFRTDLFSAAVQGAQCPGEVAAALERVCEGPVAYDAVLLLRGGGGKLDLGCFDDYGMCAAIARCPLPVLTAVGHDQDTHICDMVAFEALKTPTALADYFLDIYAAQDARLQMLRSRLDNAMRTRITLMQSKLDLLRARLDAADPLRLLEKGYTLVLGPDDHPLRSAAPVREGDRLTIMLRDGRLRVTVDEKDNNGKI